MQEQNTSSILYEAARQTSLPDMLKTMARSCTDCKPSTPISCISACQTWKVKNEFRRLHEKMMNSNYMTNLLNTLKNQNQLQVLQMISKQHYSSDQLRSELRRIGLGRSQQTLSRYLEPLIEVGLADENQNLYHATTFGRRISDLTRGFFDFGEFLPLHSECHEELVLEMLMKAPLTYETLKDKVPEKRLSRILSRLERTALVETSQEKDYVFFFATRRNPSKEMLSTTEALIHGKIPKEGISAKKLAKEAEISIRTIYKCLRKLKGKKLVFVRRKPLFYMITGRGTEVAKKLRDVRELATEVVTAMDQLGRD